MYEEGTLLLFVSMSKLALTREVIQNPHIARTRSFCTAHLYPTFPPQTFSRMRRTSMRILLVSSG